MISTTAMVVFAIQLLFIFNFFYSYIQRGTGNDRNPGRPTPLAWTNAYPAGHGNWPGDIPRFTVGRMIYSRTAGLHPTNGSSIWGRILLYRRQRLFR